MGLNYMQIFSQTRNRAVNSCGIPVVATENITAVVKSRSSFSCRFVLPIFGKTLRASRIIPVSAPSKANFQLFRKSWSAPYRIKSVDYPRYIVEQDSKRK